VPYHRRSCFCSKEMGRSLLLLRNGRACAQIARLRARGSARDSHTA
jgi:hypothetical protein